MATPVAVVGHETTTGPVRFHLSLNVDDLSRSVEFFQILFERTPSKHEVDYAKFELDEPPLVLSLEPNRVPQAGKLNHLGFRFPNAEALVAMQLRLETAGVRTTREEGVECCYSRQTKFWINDPDGNLWELYVLDDEGDHCGLNHAPRPASIADRPDGAPAIWAHRLGEPPPYRIFADSGTVDEVLLQGTFNARLKPDEPARILGEVLRVLKPGARITLHQLSASSPLPSLVQKLTGPAADVEAVPTAQQLMAHLENAGFIDIQFEKLGSSACFTADGVECREARLVGIKPLAQVGAQMREILYKGPFRAIQDDRGRTFRRGEWTMIDTDTWQQWQATLQGDQFVVRE